MARHAYRTHLLSDTGTRLRSVKAGEAFALERAGARRISDRTLVIQRALERARGNGDHAATITMADTQRNAMARLFRNADRIGDREVRARRRWHPENRRDIKLIGNATDRSMTKVEEWPHAHDRYAVTILPGGRVWIPNSVQGARRAKRLARAAAQA